MARIAPFRAERYDGSKVDDFSKVISVPYDQIKGKLQDDYYKRHDKHFVRLIFGKQSDADKPGADRYSRAKADLAAWRAEGTLVPEAKPAFYHYREEYSVPGSTDKRVRTGFIGLTRLEDFAAGIILPHEKTLDKPKADRLSLMRATESQLELVFMLYSDPTGTAKKALAAAEKNPVVLDAVDELGVRHTLRLIDDVASMAALESALAPRTLFIADGHHRYETTLAYRDEMRAKHPDYTGDEGWNFRTACFVEISDPGLAILPTHRLVANVAGYARATFLKKADAFFHVTELGDLAADAEAGAKTLVHKLAESRKGGKIAFGYHSEGKTALLTLKDASVLDKRLATRHPSYRKLDVSILHALAIEECLGLTVESLAKEANLTYHRSAAETLAAVTSGEGQCAFFLNPTRIEDVEEVASAREKMPQKSTDFYPKLASGLGVFSMAEGVRITSAQGGDFFGSLRPQVLPDGKIPARLWIPGPTHVDDDVLRELSRPQVGHREPEFDALMGPIQEKLQTCLYTKQPVMVFTSSATGVMEGSVRNAVIKRCANFVNGAFSKRWHEITVSNGLPCDKIEVPLGKPITPELVDEHLSTGKYDTVTIVHNESSTGVMSPIRDIGQLIRKKHPDVILLVDSVSSMMGVKLEFDAMGMDVLLASVQKAWALPAGIAVAAVSDRMLERAKQIKHRGTYFDFLDAHKFWQKRQTPATPAIPHLFALAYRLDKILLEGLDNRFARHQEMADLARAWARKHFAMFPEPGYESVTLSCISNTKDIDISAFLKNLIKRGNRIGGGYGDLKGKTFRIGHMGDHTPAKLKELLACADDILGFAKGHAAGA